MASWFRSWHGAPTDNKWLVIGRKAKVMPGVVSAVAWALMDYASQADDRGCVTGFDVETYSAFSGFEECDVAAVVAAMIDKGVITADGRLTAWDKRQPKRERDDETPDAWRERKQRQRERDKANAENVTPSHAMSRHVTNTDTDTDTDTDTEQRQTTTTTVVVDVTPEIAAVYSCWQDNMPGTMTPVISDDLADLVTTYGATPVIHAITEATRANVRNIRYVAGILRNEQNGTQKAPAQGSKRTNTNGKVTNLDVTKQSFETVAEMLRNGGAL